jgi:hypothetical protein
MYGSSKAFCRNFTWIGNVMFNASMSWWGPHIENLIVKENYFYNQFFKLGNNVQSSNLDAEVRDNYFMNGAILDQLTEKTIFTGNTVWNNANDPIVQLNVKSFWDPAKFSIDNNTYYKGGRVHSEGQFRLFYTVNKYREYAFNKTTDAKRYAVSKKSWQDDLELDTNSTWIDSAPSGIKVFVRPNKYDSGRANIIIYNWDEADTVNANVSSILKPGDKYELHNVQDYFGDTTSGTFSGGSLKINMTSRTKVQPIGYDQVSSWYHNTIKPNTFPTFGVFVLIKTE